MSVGLVDYLKPLGVNKQAAGPQARLVLYKRVQFAYSFSDLEKLTSFGCASRLRFFASPPPLQKTKKISGLLASPAS